MAQASVVIPVPNANGGVSAWIPSTLVTVTFAGFNDAAIASDGVLLLGTDDNSSPPTAADQLTSWYALSNQENMGPACAALGAPKYFAVIRQDLPGSTPTAGLSFTLVGDDSASSVVIVGPVTVLQGTTPWIVAFAVPQHVIVDSITGHVTVDQGTSPWVVSGAVTVSGTVTVNQGTSPWVTQDVADGTKAAASPAKAIQVGGVDDSGNLQAAQIGVNGGVRVESTRYPGAVDDAQQGATKGVYWVAYAPTSAKKGAGLPYNNFGAAATANVVARAACLLSFTCANANAAVRYIQFHDTTTTPGAGAVPVLSFPVPPAVGGVPGIIGIGTDILSTNGVWFTLGIAFAFSTTAGTYTAGAAGDQQTYVEYTQ